MIMKKILRRIIILFTTITTMLSITSCVRFKFDSKFDFDKIFNSLKKDVVATSSDVTTEIDTGENLLSLDGYVPTLSKYPLPKIGEEIFGFKVENIFDYERKNAKAVKFEHEKTGATVYLLSNDDEDRMAALGVNTVAFDNMGVPHIFEHATLGGSDNFNSANIFSDLIFKTYNTFLNAYTEQQNTAYIASSLSDEQLQSFYRVYLDGLFYPLLLHEDMLIKREAYRYVLNDKNDDISLSGVVYSEMSAHEGDIQEASHFNTLNTLYPNSLVSFDTGGDTADIPKVKNEDLIKFHEKYYHPSNMVIVLYGDIDYEKYLKIANDEYFVKFDKKEIDKEDKYFKGNGDATEKTFEFPVNNDFNAENSSMIAFSIPFDGLTAYESGIFSLVTADMSSDDGYLRTLINEKIEKADFYIRANFNVIHPYLSIVYTNVNPEDKNVLKEITEEALKETVKNGISEETLEAFIDIDEMDIELEKDSHGFVDEIMGFLCDTFRDNGKDLDSHFKYLKGIKDIKKRFGDGTVDELIDRYFGDNSKMTTTITVPKVGLAEKESENKKLELKKMKENMTDEEIENLVADNERYNQWADNNTKTSLINQVRVASISTLPEYKAKYFAYEENEEGIRFIRSDIDDIKYSYVSLLFDTSFVPYEDTLKLKLLSDLFLYMPTENYEDFKLSNEFSKYAYSYGVSIYNNQFRNGGYKPYLTVNLTMLNKHTDAVFDLVHEMIFRTKFESKELLKNYALQSYKGYISSVNFEPSSIADSIIRAVSKDGGLYNLHMEGFDYMNYLHEVSEYSDEELETLLTDLQRIYHDVFNRYGMVCELVSDFGVMSNLKSKVMNLCYEMKDERFTSQNYDDKLRKYDGNIAVAINSTVQYNYIYVVSENNGDDYTAKSKVLGEIVDNEILYKEFRVKRSCYGSYTDNSLFSRNIHTYRDPRLKETYEVYKTIPELLDEVNITDESLIDYKLNAYSYFAYPTTKLDAALSVIDETLSKWDEKFGERNLRYMREVKDTKLEDMIELKESYKKLVENGKRITIGNKDVIDANKDLFDEIIYDYIK